MENNKNKKSVNNEKKSNIEKEISFENKKENMKNLILLIMAATAINKTALTVKSPAFENNGYIPAKYTCDGTNINPEIEIGLVEFEQLA